MEVMINVIVFFFYKARERRPPVGTEATSTSLV